ncbi:hypothetical protein V8G54_001943 [Vigna mungo]|uniref:Ubiquitin-like protease family profile domain-containing protein n=1 Tax=Vigna mungo TaxID=3915 RepID=A0AAQ3P8R5_VIGMU
MKCSEEWHVLGHERIVEMICSETIIGGLKLFQLQKIEVEAASSSTVSGFGLGFYVFESWALKGLEEVCKGAGIVISSAKCRSRSAGWMTYDCVYECCVMNIVVVRGMFPWFEGLGFVGRVEICPITMCNRLQEACKRLPWKKLVFVLKVVCCSLFVHELLKLVVLTLLGALKVFVIVIAGKFQESHYLTPKWNRPKAKYWQVRTWMDTSHIVHMNSLLKSRHVSRIHETPFKCCLGIVEPIQLNLKLLKQLVRRWVPQHQSFRVRQQLVSFDVVDVVMTLGLGVGGLEISFDESIVGKVGELLNSSETKAKELVNMFDNIVGNDDLDVDVVCRLCNKKLLTGKIADSVSISGSDVVLQVWVYERLGLHSDPSCRVFPRLMRFRSLSYGTEEIDLLFRQGEVHFEWYIRSVERQDPIIRRAFNMDALARTAEEPEKGDNSCQPPLRKNNQKIKSFKDEIVGIRKALIERRKRKRFYQNISVDEAGVDVVGEGNEGGLEEATIDDTIADGAGVDEGVVVEKAFAETAGHEQETTTTPVDEGVADEAAFGETAAHEEETTVAPVDEGVVDEVAFGETAAHEEETTVAPVDEDGATAAAVDGCAASEAVVDGSAASEAAVDGSAATAAPVDEAAAPAAPVDEAAAPAAAVDEARAIEEPVHEADEDVVDELPPRDSLAFVDIGGDDDDADQLISVVQPLVVEPLSTIPADLIARVDLDKLYQCVTRKDIAVSYVCEIMGQLLTTRDCSSLGPRECVDNMVIIFAATMFMYFEKRSTGVIKRMIFSPMFGTHLLTDNKRRVAKRQVWQLIDYQAYFRQDLVRLHDLLSADWVFIPVVTKNHWWCYALRPCTMQFFVIDSLDKGISGRGSIDRSIVRFTVEVQLSLMKLLAKNIQRFWGMLSNSFEDSKIPFNVEQAKIPVQPNTFDCGLIMMKVMEIWDGEDKYDGKSMPDYSNEELAAFRRKYICDWILNGENIRILGVLQHYGLVLPGFLNAAPNWVLGTKMDAITGAASLPQANRLCNRLLRPCKRLPGEYMDYVLNVGRLQVKLCSSSAVSFPQQNRYCNRLLRPCKRLPGIWVYKEPVRNVEDVEDNEEADEGDDEAEKTEECPNPQQSSSATFIDPTSVSSAQDLVQIGFQVLVRDYIVPVIAYQDLGAIKPGLVSNAQDLVQQGLIVLVSDYRVPVIAYRSMRQPPMPIRTKQVRIEWNSSLYKTWEQLIQLGFLVLVSDYRVPVIAYRSMTQPPMSIRTKQVLIEWNSSLHKTWEQFSQPVTTWISRAGKRLQGPCNRLPFHVTSNSINVVQQDPTPHAHQDQTNLGAIQSACVSSVKDLVQLGFLVLVSDYRVPVIAYRSMRQPPMPIRTKQVQIEWNSSLHKTWEQFIQLGFLVLVNDYRVPVIAYRSMTQPLMPIRIKQVRIEWNSSLHKTWEQFSQPVTTWISRAGKRLQGPCNRLPFHVTSNSINVVQQDPTPHAHQDQTNLGAIQSSSVSNGQDLVQISFFVLVSDYRVPVIAYRCM